MITKDLGAVTAYAEAVEAGYTGTEEEYAALLASYATVAQNAAASASAAATSATAAAGSATSAAASASEASTTVSGAITNIEAAGTAQVGLVTAEGTTQIGLVSAEGAAQVSAVDAKGAEVIESIPEDYTELSADVTQLKSDFDVYKNKTTGKSIFNSASLGSSSSVGSHWNFYHDVSIPSGTPIKFTVDSYSGSHFSGAIITAYKTPDSYDVLSPVVSAIGVPQKYTTTSAYIKIKVDIVRTETENNVSCAYSVEIYTGENILTSVYNNTNNIETNADDIADIEKACDNIEANIDYIDPVIITTADFSNGMYYTDSTWKTNGNFGKCLSNKTLFKVCDFTVKAETETFTNILLTIKCFNASSEFVGNYISQSADIQSGSYSVKEASIKALYSNTSYISLTFSKISGTTYYDMPSDFEVEVLDDAPTLAERVKVLEDNSSTIGTVVIVAKDGGGMYTSITDAVNSILDDSASKRYTILIKPGVYDEHIHVGGSRYLSFVGENRETCIIRSHTGMYTDAPIWIDGNFTIENLTLQMLDDEAPESWTPGMSIDDPATMLPGYALHIDGSSNTQVDPVYGYKLGVVRNCTLYSVAYPAIGCGLHSNQMLLFDNCKFIRNTSAKYNYNEPAVGAMLVHESLTAGSVNQNLEIKDCVFICNLNKAASFRFNHGYSSTLKYALINNTFWCEETGSSVVNAELDEAVLLGYSHGNNNSTFNA